MDKKSDETERQRVREAESDAQKPPNKEGHGVKGSHPALIVFDEGR